MYYLSFIYYCINCSGCWISMLRINRCLNGRWCSLKDRYVCVGDYLIICELYMKEIKKYICIMFIYWILFNFVYWR